MESRTERLFLSLPRAGAGVVLLLAVGVATAADEAAVVDTAIDEVSDVDAGIDAGASTPGLLDPAGEEPLVEPEVQRRKLREVKIDSENFAAGLYAGVLSIEDFGSDLLAGGMLAWHFSEDLFLQAHFYQSEAGLSSYEVLSGSTRLFDDRTYTGYDLSVGYNLFPGEAFVGRKRAFNTAFYLLAGVGSTDFAGEDRLTLNLGVGYRLLVNDWLAWHVGFRDHMFSSDLTGEDKQTHNMELSAGLTTFF